MRRALGLLFAATLLFATTAEAQQQISMVGKIASKKGPIVQIPQVGNTLCLSHQIGLGVGVVQGTMTPYWTNIPGASSPAPIPGLQIPSNVGQPQHGNLNGCVKGQTVTDGMGAGGAYVNTAVSPASFTVPTEIFNLQAPLVKNVTPPPAGGIIQFGSQAYLHGPQAGPVIPLNAAATALHGAAQWRQFKKDAWMTQTGRPGLNFTNCWGATAPGNPGVVGPCTNINQGTQPILAKYHGSAANFGGTMSLLFDQAGGGGSQPGTLAITKGVAPGQLLIKFNSAVASAPGARGYRGTQTAPAGMSILYASWMTTPGTTIQGGMTPLVKSVGASITSLTGTLATLVNFPFTVGSVLVRNTGGLTTGGNPMTITLTAMGSDARTAGGLGRIQLVSGGLISSSQPSESIDIMSLTFGDIPVPVLGPWGLGLLGMALGTTGGGIFLRRRSKS